MNRKCRPVLGFVAPSGTGKTTLLAKLIPLLKARGLRVGLIKHSHHDYEIDVPGKDSHVLRQAGATPVLLTSPYRRTIIAEHESLSEPTLAGELAVLENANVDLILVEGFKQEHFPKIELHRPSLGKPLLARHDKDIIAIATDASLPPDMALPRLDLNAPQDILRFVEDWMEHQQYRPHPA